MRGLFLGATIAAALIGVVLSPSPARADAPQPPADDALAQLVLAGAPLTASLPLPVAAGTGQAVRSTATLLSSVGIPPAPVPLAPPPDAGATVEHDPAVSQQAPDPPNPFDVFSSLDPRTWASDIVNAGVTAICKALLEAVRGFLDWAQGFGSSSLNFVTRTPASGTYDSPTVHSLWDLSRALANAALAAIVLWGGFNIIVKEHTRSPYHGAMELLPRLILATLAANLTLEFARFLIDANNAVAGAIGQVGLPGYDQASPAQDGMALIVTALAYAVVGILLVLQMLMRLALIDLLIVLAPVASLCWVLPQTQGWTRWWANLFPTTVFQQAVQVMVLRLGTALMLELTPGNLSNALLTLFLGIAVCWLTLKVPALLRAGTHQAGLSSAMSLVLISRVAGGLISGGGSAAAAAAAAAASRGGDRSASDGSLQGETA